MASLIRINAVVQRPNGKLFVNATLPDGRVAEGEIAVSLDQMSIARAMAQLPAARPMPHLTGQVTLEDDEYRELRIRAVLAEEQARREALSLAQAATITLPAPEPAEPLESHESQQEEPAVEAVKKPAVTTRGGRR